MTLELADAHEMAWDALREATQDPEHPFRYVSLATAGADGQPQTRLLVLREADRYTRSLTFHTDVRSSKWNELTENAAASVLGFDPAKRLQLRLLGHTELFAPGSKENDAAWSALNPWTKRTYCGGPPGDTIATEVMLTPNIEKPTHGQVARGRDRFGVIRFRVYSLDWFQLARSNNRRARFEYSGGYEDMTSAWIEP